ncbi:MAG: ABC transporter permease [Deltaproteobacteria bacterium]|nr:ABC transporter permease [Deltaproteobacteria bacterium]
MKRLLSMALRNVGRNRRRSLLTGLTVFFGVMVIVNARGLMWGLQSMLIEDTVEARVGALQVHRRGYVDSADAAPLELSLPADEPFRQRLLAIPNVAGASGRLVINGQASNGRAQTLFVGRGVDLAHELETCPRSAVTVKAGGSMLQPADADAALLGSALAGAFGVGVGGSVALQATSPGGRVNSLDVQVKGLTESAFPFENQRVAVLPLSTAQGLVGMAGRVTEYAVRVHELSRLEETADALRAALGPDVEVHTWRDLQAFLRDVIYRQNTLLGGVSLLLFVVVLTGIINTMSMSVFERTREIGMLLALGVRRRAILQLFLLEGVLIGLAGGLMGALAGRLLVGGVAALGISFNISGIAAVTVLRPQVTPLFVAAAVAVAVSGSVLASLWPAWRASRLDPVQALRS